MGWAVTKLECYVPEPTMPRTSRNWTNSAENGNSMGRKEKNRTDGRREGSFRSLLFVTTAVDGRQSYTVHTRPHGPVTGLNTSPNNHTPQPTYSISH